MQVNISIDKMISQVFLAFQNCRFVGDIANFVKDVETTISGIAELTG
jgi:hypothetical protein